jgi:cytochrome c oxidase subunit III
MAATTIPAAKSKGTGTGSGDGSGDGRGGGGASRRPLPPQTYRMGVVFALASVSMLFMAMTSAYVIRNGLDPDWRAIRMPSLLLFNTAVLLVSSGALEMARRGWKCGDAWHIPTPRTWIAITLSLGVAFLCGQLAVWGQLSAQGIYLSTNPQSSFFYLLTGLHGLHLLGGIFAMSWLFVRASQARHSELAALPVHRIQWVEAATLYWHFMDGLWLYLLVLLFAWR